uniref:Uncharacterized protein n=1 Tax=Arundo donax TaxID=35708 RepID=A0A0A9CHL5_ARUDO
MMAFAAKLCMLGVDVGPATTSLAFLRMVSCDKLQW